MTVEIDCTPQEARTLAGLPDLEPLQAAVLARIEERVMDATSKMSAEGIVKTWFSLLPGAEQYVKTMTGFLNVAARPGDPRDGSPDDRR